ncbi:hypothetical protein MTO96_000713 [Rhipicephalus appendiculatus]
MRKYTREAEEASENDEEDDRKQTYAEWARDQKKALEKFTQEITTTAETPFVDARLAHMWAARHSLTRRWKRQRHNKKLVKRIAVLNKQIAEYAAKLYRETWLSTCDGLQGKLSARKTWCLLRHIIDPLSSKTASNRNLTKVLNTYKGDGQRLLADLKEKYLKTERGEYPTPDRYEGPENKELDRPFTMTELWSAIDESNRKSAPGRDAITYKLLGNMSEVLTKANRDTLNTMLRKATKQAMGMPMYSSTQKLLDMSAHNTVEELIEAHLSSQRVRLSQTEHGRAVLRKIGWQIGTTANQDGPSRTVERDHSNQASPQEHATREERRETDRASQGSGPTAGGEP